MTPLLQDSPQTYDSKGLSNPNNCATCDHKRYPDGGHCYMFRDEPKEVCHIHTGRALLTMSMFANIEDWMEQEAKYEAEMREEAADIRNRTSEPLPTDAQVAAQDSMFGVLPEVKR